MERFEAAGKEKNLKKRIGIILGLLLGLLLSASCSGINDLYISSEPVSTDTVPQSGSDQDAKGLNIPPVSDTVLSQIPAQEYEKDREELGLTDENYQLLHEEMAGCFAYEALSMPEKLWYLDMYQIILDMESDVALYDGYLDQLGIGDIDKIFQCVLSDHPEFFYINGYTYTHFTQGEETVRITFSGSYTMDREEVRIRQEQIDAYVEECLAGLPEGASDYEKTKYVYDYLISHTEYHLEAPENQNICSVFIGRQSVCQGYAKATQYLLNRMGVFATLVVGQVSGGQGHAWNLVRLDGKYYYVDTTWGDASYQTEGLDIQTEVATSINYDYLCVTTEQLVKTHTIDNVVPVPLCRNMENNYYVREGAYFTTYDESALRSLFERGYNEKKQDVTIKCSSAGVYYEMMEKLIEGQEIFRYMDDSVESIAYAGNETQLSLTFWLSAE